MSELAIYGLICRYPTLKSFIVACVKERDLDKLLDFLHGIELKEEKVYLNTILQ